MKESQPFFSSLSKTRNEIANELVKTEESYVTSLKIIVDVKKIYFLNNFIKGIFKSFKKK